MWETVVERPVAETDVLDAFETANAGWRQIGELMSEQFNGQPIEMTIEQINKQVGQFRAGQRQFVPATDTTAPKPSVSSAQEAD